MSEEYISPYSSTYPGEPNWEDNEDQLYIETREAIEDFASENPDKEVSFIAFDTEPCYGYVIINFDTKENERKVAVEDQNINDKSRNDLLSIENAWSSAKYHINENQNYEFSQSTGSFEFSHYYQLEFDEWQEFSDSFDELLSDQDDVEDQENEFESSKHFTEYLEGHVILIFWQVIERLIADGVLDVLKQASPLRVGYSFHDQGSITVVKIINL